ncbi:MAG: TIGR03009 domain-containing protein [Pirellulales bacterium]
MMNRRIAWLLALVVTCEADRATAQTESAAARPNPSQAAPQPVENPAARRVAPAPQEPFQLTPQQQAALDLVLRAWEQRSAKVDTFKCSFTRWEYDPVFGPTDPNAPKNVSQGNLKYKTPDKGMFRVAGTTPEQWVCDGKSIFEFNYTKRELIERKLPPDMQGKAIVDSPLPFLFGAQADRLKQRYFMRILPASQKGQILLEAYPRFRQDAANFRKTELLLTEKDMLPFALQIFLPNGKSRTVYQFENVSINNILDIFDFSSPRTPLGWKKIVEDPQQVARQPSATGKR